MKLFLAMIIGVVLGVYGSIQISELRIGRMKAFKCYQDGDVVYKPALFVKGLADKRFYFLQTAMPGSVSQFYHLVIKQDVFEVECN